MNPLVSIIIPYVRDRGYLKEAIQSIEKQTYRNIEIIESRSAMSVSFNLNRGIEEARGEYIKYLCDDDMLPPRAIEFSLSGIKKAMALHGCAINLFLSGRKEIFTPPMQRPTLTDMLKVNCMHGGSLMYHKSIFDKYGLFDETLWTGEEYEYNLRLLSNNVRFAYSPENLYLYRRHPKQKSLGSQDLAYRKLRIEAINEIKAKYLMVCR